MSRASNRPALALFCIALCAFAIVGGEVSACNAAEIEGIWRGTLKVGANELRLVFHITKDEAGMLVATVDSPDQGAKGIPVEQVTFENGKLRVVVAVVAGLYEGTASADLTEIEGTWSQGGQQFPLAVKRTNSDEIEQVDRPQEPKPPLPYASEDVVFENKKADITLAGTLTLPHDGGAFAAALLISGSGPQDRDEALMGHKPFLVIADHLTRNGIAVLRYDDRGVGQSTGDFSDATSEDFATDVQAGVEFLRNHSKIDAKKIGLAGHSEGALIAPLVASKDHDIAFVVLLAGPGVTGEEILYAQSELLARSQGASEADIASQRSTQEKMFAIVKSEPDLEKAKPQLVQVVQSEIDALSDSEREALGDLDAFIAAQTRLPSTKWFQFFLTYDPQPALRGIKCPTLVLNGEKDLQVPPQQNLPAIERALEAGGNSDFTIKELPSLNHLFQTAETGSILEYGKITETFSPAVLEIISGWINKHTR